MRRSISRGQPAATPAAPSLDAELNRIAAMNKDELRTFWRQTKGQQAPDALSRDLLARALTYWRQEERLGGLSPTLRRQLAALAGKPGSEPVRHVKPGSIIVREYQGTIHEVMVVPDGFCWQGQIYASLSTIARKITGTSWNGPRFFGLRGKEKERAQTGSSAARKKAIGLPPGTAPAAGRLEPKPVNRPKSSSGPASRAASHKPKGTGGGLRAPNAGTGISHEGADR
jgi:hypothetical protein